MPPAGQNLFEKRFQHLQKLLFKALRAYYIKLRMSSRTFAVKKKCNRGFVPFSFFIPSLQLRIKAELSS